MTTTLGSEAAAMMGLREYIAARSTPVPESGCWLWDGGWSKKGYGTTGMGGQNYAHRLSYQEFTGPIPDGLMVCHKCDTRACVNPEHLFIGTAAHNSADAKAKGRMHPGTSNYNSKLNPELVTYIRASSLPNRTLAKELGLAYATVGMARRGQTWRNV